MTFGKEKKKGRRVREEKSRAEMSQQGERSGRTVNRKPAARAEGGL